MLRAAISFFILALLAFVFGAYGIAGLSMEIGRTILFIFLVLAIISFVGHMAGGKRGRGSFPS